METAYTQKSLVKQANKPESEIILTNDAHYKKYINNALGFEFEFPAQAYEPQTCEKTTKGYDNYGNEISVQPSYVVGKSGLTDISVIETKKHVYTIAPVKAPVFSDEKSDNSGATYYNSCSVQKLNKENVKSTDFESRSWFVAKAETEKDVKDMAGDAYNSANLHDDALSDQKYTVTFGKLKNNRQRVEIIPNPAPMVGGFQYDAWFYPDDKIFVYFASGQSPSFQSDEQAHEMYGEKILSSFKLR